MALQPMPWLWFLNTDSSLTQNLMGQYNFDSSTTDSSGASNNATIQGTVTAATGRKGLASTAYSFDGTTGYLSTTIQYTNPTDYSINVWFNTTTTGGGVLVGFASSATGTPTNFDRMFWMDTTGHLNFGTYIGSIHYFTTPGSYNDGTWHMGTAVMNSSTGMTIYVDGVSVATDANTTSQTYNGYWRIGQDQTSGGWPATEGSYFAGTLDDISIYSVALSATQVSELYRL